MIKLSKEKWLELARMEDDLACKHCGAVVLAGPPCCDGIAYDLDAPKRAEAEATKVRQEAARQRRLARRAERRAKNPRNP